MNWDWKKTAGEARQRLAAAKHGAREAALKEAGGSRDVNTVRRAVAALDFLDRLKETHPQSYGDLKDSPFGVVETFSRWWSISPTDAAVGLETWKNGGLTTRGLAASMRKSRPPIVEAANDESLARTFSEYVEPRIRHGIETVLGTKITPSENKRSAQLLPVDFRYSFKDSFRGEVQVAAIVVGPYQNQTIYRKKRHDWMLKALGLTHFFDWVFVALPSQSAVDDYTSWIERAHVESGTTPITHLLLGPPADPLNRLRILVVQ